MNSATKNIPVKHFFFFFWTPVYTSFEYKSKNGISGSYGNFRFNILRNHPTAFHKSFTILHSHQQSIEGSDTSTSLPTLAFFLFFFFFQIAILMAIKECLFVVLICLLLMTTDVEHLSMYLL